MPTDYNKLTEKNVKELGTRPDKRKSQVCQYSDPSHFVYELLQNADDYQASAIKFLLRGDRLIVEHDGSPFTPSNVRAITTFEESTSEQDLVKTGRFGIGFKSVFAITATPQIHSGKEHFKIYDLYKVCGIGPPKDLQEGWTRFVFPFDHATKKPVFVYPGRHVTCEKAQKQISNKLRDLRKDTLLFTRNVREIRWEIATETSSERGHYLREDTKSNQEVFDPPPRKTSIIDEQGTVLTYMVFARQINWEDEQHKPVEIAFRLEDEDEDTILPDKGRVFVLFATEHYPTMGLTVNGPYRTTPNRESIARQAPFNDFLVDKTADLLAEAMPVIKKMGLLNVDFLEALPLCPEDSEEHIDKLFAPLFTRTREELRHKKLLPTADGGHVAGENAKLARGVWLVDLFSSEQLSELMGHPGELCWLSKEITEGSREQLHTYLVGKKERYGWPKGWVVEPLVDNVQVEPEDVVVALTKEFLQKQSDDWLRHFYSCMLDQRSLWYKLKDKPIIRLTYDQQVRPSEAYLPPEEERHSEFPTVKKSLLWNDDAKGFLKGIRLTVPGIVDEVLKFVIPKYEDPEKAARIDWDTHVEHLDEIVSALEVDSHSKRQQLREKLQETPFLWACRADDGERGLKCPNDLYFKSEELSAYFSGSTEAWFVSCNYDKRYCDIFADLGATSDLRIKCASGPHSTEDVHLPYAGGYRRGLEGFDPDIQVDGLERAIMFPSVKKSEVIWNKIVVPYCQCLRGEILRSSRKDFSPNASTYETKQETSDIGRLLTESEWLPATDGRFCKTAELTLDDLPHSFVRNENAAAQLKMRSSAVRKVIKELGVPEEQIDKTANLLGLLKDHPEKWPEVEAVCTERGSDDADVPEWPDSSSANPKRRGDRVGKRARQSGKRTYKEQKRSVRTSSPDRDTEPYLRNLYTNRDGKMVCQICEEEMPFKKPGGDYYFEAVELLGTDMVDTEHAELHAALCPICAAKYKIFIKNNKKQWENVLRQLIQLNDGDQFPLQLDTDSSMRFVKKHLIDIKAVIGNVVDQ